MENVTVVEVTRKFPGFVSFQCDKCSKGTRAWLSGPDAGEAGKIEVGDTVSCEIVESKKIDKYGKPYLNFISETLAVSKGVNPGEEGVEKRHGERQDGQALGNAKTNATNLTIALINAGKLEGGNNIEACLKKYTMIIYNIDVSDTPTNTDIQINADVEEPLPF